MIEEKNKYFDALEGLRGVAALCVALFHWLLSFDGFLAVDFFLVLSGFILSHRYLHSDKTTSPFQFVSSRLARLYPMHIFGLLTYALTYYFLTQDIPRYKDGTFFTFLQQLSLTHNIGINQHSQTWNIPSWSISVEFWLNLIFFFYISRKTSSTSLFFTVIACLITIKNLTGHIDTTYQNYFQVLNSGMVRGWASFALGILAYRTWVAIPKSTAHAWIAQFTEVALITSIIALITLRNGKMRELDFLAPFLFFLITLCFAFEAGIISKCIARIKRLGTISYSIYLNHLIVLMIVDTALNHTNLSKLALAPIYIACVLAFSELTYRIIELPGKRLMNGLAAKIIKRNHSTN